MNRPNHASNTLTSSLGLALLASLIGCSEATCPSGSKEVDGTCQLADLDAVNTGDSGAKPDGALEECEGTLNARGECLSEVDPCGAVNGKPACDLNASCEVLSDAAECSCNEGYEGDGKTCVRNPCLPIEGEAAACGANTECSAESAEQAVCSCAEGYEDCDGASDTGCEISLLDDAANCGACGFACAPGLSCEAGECERKYQSLSLGTFFSDRCLLKENGDVYCWGEAIKPPNGPTTLTPTKVQVDPAAELRMQGSFACTRARDGDRVTCWGNNTNAELGKTASSGHTEHSFDLPGIQSLSSAFAHACAVADGRAYCWGLGSGGQLGDGFDYTQAPTSRGFNASRPVLAAIGGKPVSGAVEIAASLTQSCVRLQSGGVQCWGSDSGSRYYAEPVQAEGSTNSTGTLIDAQSICAGVYYNCALRKTGEVVCWGRDPQWWFRNGTATSAPTATVPRNRFRSIALPNVTQIACGTLHTCAVDAKGDLYCWGSNTLGQLGIGSSEESRILPTRVPTLSDVAEVYAGAGTCARLRNGSTYCWGDPKSKESTPVEVMGWP